MTAAILAAAAAAPDTLISGNWIIGVIVAVITAAGGVWLRKTSLEQGRRQAVTLSEPVPTVPIRKVSTPPSWDQHADAMRRICVLEHGHAEMRRDMAQQYREILEAGGMRELRIMDKLDGIASGIHARINGMLDPKHKP